MTGTTSLAGGPAAPAPAQATAAVFDVCGALPTGTTVLEASAGTGKTFTIAALTARYVAEGVADLEQVLLVTFGRAATSELRDRVRERLVDTARALRSAQARACPDGLVRHLADVDDPELDRRRTRLERAVAQFDSATIATTHGFCQQMLTSLGVAGDLDADAVLVPDIADLVDEVVDDLYVQRYADAEQPRLSAKDARAVARAAVSDPQATLEPAQAPPDTPAGHRVGFAREVRAEVERRKRRLRILDYDDLLILLLRSLTHPEHGPAAVERVRARYQVVLVDEFQDTDPVQWEILRTAFHGHRTLVLIGDPKQAVYAFRGGDVVTYLDARAAAEHEATLGRNWRSDAPLLAGIDRVLGGAALGDQRILVRPVEPEHRGRRLTAGAPLRLRHVTRAALGAGPSRTPPVGRVRQFVAEDVASDVVRQLSAGRILAPERRALEPADIAVLTRRNADALLVRDVLSSCGVPAVVSGLSSVFGSPAARAWLTLLRALEQPGHTGRTAAAALSPFVGWDAARLAGAGDAERDDLSELIRSWAQVLARRGVAALLEAASGRGLGERLLGTVSGERLFTDLRHVGQSLHLAATQEGLGVSALAHWLRRRVAEAGDDYAEERSRRLETDAAAVQVVTIHASKGLEFPVVYVPFAWDRFESDRPLLLRYHDDQGRRRLHVGGDTAADYEQARGRHFAEERGEDLRLLYVALTRARSQAVVWWAPSRNSAAGPLTRLLLGGAPPGHEPPPRVSVPRDPQVAAVLAELAATSAGSIAVEQVDTAATRKLWVRPPCPSLGLSVAAFERRLDESWRRTSYTGLTAAAHDSRYGAVASEPEARVADDEAEAIPPGGLVGAGGESGLEPPEDAGWVLPMADMPSGTAFGTLVHGVLERVDTSAADLELELRRRCQEVGAFRLAGVDSAALAAALAAVMTTPLGPLGGGSALADVRPGDRLAELEFELPLAGGDTPTSAGVTVREIGQSLRRHLAPDDAFAGYADRLAASPFAGTRLRGYLTGSLDAVVRIHQEDHPRYLVVDYKTNRLAPAGEPLAVRHYRPAAMAEAMMAADYPLQLLLYLVALHRFLRWRQPGYDPSIHLGGGLYLFVRGMCGPATPPFDGTPAGVMPWRPPAALVAELSALLDGRSG